MKKQHLLLTTQVALFVAILTLVSKILGLVKNQFLAAYFGTTYVTDTLNLANAIPSMIFAGILGATATSFVPVYSKTVEQEGDLEGNLFTSRIINLLVFISIVSSLVGILFSRQIVTIFTMPEVAGADTGYSLSWYLSNLGWLLTHGWEGARLELASFYVKVTFSYCLFTSVTGIIGSWLQYKHIFIRPVIVGYILNLSVIVFILIAYHENDPKLLVFGLFSGVIIHCIILCIIAAKNKYHYSFDFRMTSTVRKILVLAVPVFIGTTVTQINLFVDKALASGLREGSIAALDFASLLITFATGMTVGVIAMILYPKMAKAFSLEDEPRFTELLSAGISVLVILGVPLTMGALIYDGSVVKMVYLRGAFNYDSLDMTQTAFFFYSISLLPQMLAPLLINAFYSRHNTRTPLILSCICVVINICACLLLVGPLALGGIALGTSIAQTIFVITLLLVLRKRITGIITRAFMVKCVKVFIASSIAVFGTLPFFLGVRILFENNGWLMPQTVMLGLTVLLAAGIYILLLKLLKIEELKHIRSMLNFKQG